MPTIRPAAALVLIPTLVFGAAACTQHVAVPNPQTSDPQVEQVNLLERQVTRHRQYRDDPHQEFRASPLPATAHPKVIWASTGTSPARTEPTVQPAALVVAERCTPTTSPVIGAAPPAATPAPKPPDAEAPAAIEPELLDRTALLAQLYERIRASDDPQMSKALSAAALGILDPAAEVKPTLLENLSPKQKRKVRAFRNLILKLAVQLSHTPTSAYPATVEAQVAALFDGPIRISNLALCRRVMGWGRFDEFKREDAQIDPEQPYIFDRKNPMKLGLYIELERFRTTHEAEDRHVVLLEQQVALYTNAGLRVWNANPSELEDICRRPRRDFFTTQIITFPANLSVGKYHLKLRVTDRNSHTVDEKTVPIHIVARQTLASDKP